MARPLAGGRAHPGAAADAGAADPAVAEPVAAERSPRSDAAPRSDATPQPLETEIITSSAAETAALGHRIARVARAGDLVCLWGELGAGKTQLAKGFALGLGIEATITSPTFILMAEYPGRLPLFHVDLFRLADAADALAGGVIDDRQADGVTLVEWPDRMGDVLPAGRLDIRIDGSADERRTIAIVATDNAYRRYVEAASS
ncbi:MAG TPA: tRNA (adenosine(37)-N6)-threonylcarbamoyltransferase complex ATPase subunit type 1 TsaE [Verrucomicrobiae bacterium]|nr:tRNA (adenosine(37)-N6)-threonylcarbamoyltransferase complex ATPase subunit type 1 TsaE [Verrucomicrobiae bacterium]